MMNRRDFIISLGALASNAGLKNAANASAFHPPIPMQPFTVELLDLNRGDWTFLDWDGQHLRLPHPAFAFAYPHSNTKTLQIRYLLCDPEFPRDPAHGVILTATPMDSEADTLKFRINEPFFSCEVSVVRNGPGMLKCLLSNLILGSPMDGDRYVEAVYLTADGEDFPLWLVPPKAATGPILRLLTNRVGNIFSGEEDVRIRLVGLGVDISQEMEIAFHVTDYATQRPVWSGSQKICINAANVSMRSITIPLKRFGIFALTAVYQGEHVAALRICRIPKPRKVNPEQSRIGINIFQQQVWWYAFQVPMMAAAGVHWIRPWLAWENTWNNQQPQSDQWRTKPLDAALRRMYRYGMRYQDILFQAPQWVAGGAQCGTPPMNRLKDWGNYVRRLAAEYKDRIPCYEIWNEPDGMWQQERNRSAHYLALLKTSWLAAKEADPKCRILGLSLAGDLDWLEKVCEGGAARYMDIATFHNYASPADFVKESRKRIAILERYGIHRCWINELGVTAYDFNTAYSRKYSCSERNQAITLTENYAQAMTLNPEMKAFWFCTHDPRDAAHESGWTGDAGIGILYLGFLPKLAYAALAGYAWMADGKRCLGMARNPESGVRQVSFVGPVSVVWREGQRQFSPLPATEAGCLAGERIIVRDINTNLLANGNAGEVMLDFANGPVYIEGSHQMAGIASAEAEFCDVPEELNIGTVHSAELAFSVPHAEKINIVPHPSTDFIVGTPTNSSDTRKITMTPENPSHRLFGILEVSMRYSPPAFGLQREVELTKRITVTANGGPNLIADGAFCQANFSDWTIQGESKYAYDGKIGHLLPGSLRLIAPFSQRFVQWNIKPERDNSLFFKCWIKSDHLSGCRITLNLAWFGSKDWVSTSCLASTGEEARIENGWQTVKGFAHISVNTKDWEPIEVALTPPYMPNGADHAAFFIDATGGGSGRIWIDELDLWQP